MIKQFGDWVVDWTERTSDDEYQATMTYKADTVAMWMMPLAAIISGAILAWVLPSTYSLWSALPIFTVLIVQIASQSWMSNYAPRPKQTSPTKYMLLGVIPGVIMLAGMAYNSFFTTDQSWAGPGGVVVGAIIGAGTALLLIPRIFKSRHKSDVERLESDLED
ncbi:YtxH domain-containing protein [Corynebacterium lubricantis]|uniref:YtxH domain-containing protein n=1 Tax=Corynebacterium lubricantis TaxID=541095 RepID=UPI000374B5D1|nr:YtxH domain-containing protein [Corynebacterium lubricantis]